MDAKTPSKTPIKSRKARPYRHVATPRPKTLYPQLPVPKFKSPKKIPLKRKKTQTNGNTEIHTPTKTKEEVKTPKRVREEEEVSEQPAKKTKNNYSFHTFNFSSFKPQGIKSIALNANQTLCAVGRFDGSIEIWYTNSDEFNEWIAIKKIPGKKNTTVESLVWIGQPGNERLFSAGLHGFITEWDLETLSPKTISDGVGGAIWHLATNPDHSLLAAACESGKIVIYDTDLVFKKMFGPSTTDEIPNIAENGHCKGTRLQCITFTPDGERIIAGGFTGVYCYSLNGELQYRITIDKGIVWRVLYLNDDSLVVGDSTGRVYFCDGVFGTIMNTFREHQADILAIATDSTQENVYATGVDAKICLFQRNNKGKWTYATGKRPAFHDIHAIAIYHDQYIISGGVDCRLTITNIKSYQTNMRNPFWFLSHHPVQEVIHYSPKTRILLVNESGSFLKLMKIPKHESMKDLQTMNHNINMDFTEEPSFLLSIQPMSKGEWNFDTCAISSDAQWVATSTLDAVILYKIKYIDDKRAIVDEEYKLDKIKGGHHVAFSGDASKLIVISRDSVIQIIDVNTQQLIKNITSNFDHMETELNTLDNHEIQQYLPNCVNSIATSENWLVVAYNSEIIVYDLSSTLEEPHWTINTSTGIIYKVGFYSKDTFFMITTGNNIGFFNAKSKSTKLPSGTLNCSDVTQYPISTVIPVSKTDKILLIPTRNRIQVINSEGERGFYFALNKGVYTSTLGCIKLGENEIMVVQLPLEQFTMSLPGVCYRHRFGV